MLYRRAQFGDYERIVELQNKNLFSRQQNDLASGFLSTQYTAAHFQQMNEAVGVVVCEHENNLIGYLGSCHIDFFRQFPVASAMIDKISTQRYQDLPLDFQQIVFANPVCIEKQYRGQGVYLELCKHLLPYYPKQYNKAITLVAVENQCSYTATSRLGFEVIDQFAAAGKFFYVMMIDLIKFAEYNRINQD